MRGSTATPASQTGVVGEQRPVGRLAIALLVAATFGSGMAMIVPMAYSLAVRLEELAPGRPDLLGVLLGVGSAATLVVAPLTGVLSDRTRSRWGRRRPFTVVGIALGVAAVPVLVTAPTVPVLAVGWILSTVGWNTAGASIGNWQADRLAAQQRGTVSGLTGLTMQISPVLGILLVGTVRSETLLVFAIPAVVGVLLAGAFACFAADPDSRGPAPLDRMTLRRILGSYFFDPRAFPEFTWNWIGRFVFFVGLSLTTSFTVFFFAQRLDLAVPDVAGVLALTSALSIGTALVGSLGGGWLSDRTGVRRPFVVAGAALFAVGSIVSATAGALPTLLIGSLLSSLGIALFSAVGQALSLDVLPHREIQAGRYTAITLFAQKIPGVISPLAAPLVLALGGGENFTALYLTAAALALLGGALIGVTVRRPTHSPSRIAPRSL
ncbi:MFS transporter [Microbacterium sp. Leaf179]|uniref:MFS transporter n=1 Tax=Microbacterium sp. Leaf179 TaxID=1736288 RepID=UPI0006F5CB80|nr:MFS transporter [Microbacterium sp. Leaf179]KQR89013.1 hypothetical protein ASF96_04520 [Microbacterium sp. Leaf179]